MATHTLFYGYRNRDRTHWIPCDMISVSAKDLSVTADLDHKCSFSVLSNPIVLKDHGRYAMSSSPVPLKTRRVGQRCTLNLSRAETSSRWCGVVVRRGGGASSGVVHVT
ncbi:hypothetical protein TNCV_4383581 [Trichonephila clavipes]|nr:hypothetical protein TNCV_4383581 [Trichonephila clavipes]